MKTYGRTEVELHAFLTSALDVGKWSVSSPDRLIPKTFFPGIYWRGGWVDPGAGWMQCRREETLALKSIESRLFGRPARSLVTILTELSRLFGCIINHPIECTSDSFANLKEYINPERSSVRTSM
jgi:hypothetical protein